MDGSAPPVRPVSVAWSPAAFEQQEDGSTLVRPEEALGPYPDRAGVWLEHWAGAAPERPVAILSGNGIHHALLMLACLHVGVPVASKGYEELAGRLETDAQLRARFFSRLRLRLLDALQPYVRDVVVAGLDRDYLAVLAVPAAPEAAGSAAARAALLERMAALAAEATGSSVRVRRLAFLTAPLSIDAGEMTDKGSINQRRVLESHAYLVEQLYAEPRLPHVLCIDARAARAA